jgi:hypothetical protein
MTAALTPSLGWAATAVFVGSYFFRRPATLRITQMCGAALWILYGVFIHAAPVIAANALVCAAAAWTMFSEARSPREGHHLE